MKPEILIFSYKIARDLIQNGFVVRDIRPNHKVHNGTVVVFEKNEGIKMYLKEKWNIEG
ncbi:hypothetical protein ACR77J_07930 [Tissierella praeacuta]|uniref:hypothetical protein n=1 Tax=Tissierella praeacuta TaxID=43131 RepID=UPI003DA412D8